MIVYINQVEISVFAGARIQDAILAFSRNLWKQVRDGELAVYDRLGNLTDPDGPMLEGQNFTLKRTESK